MNTILKSSGAGLACMLLVAGTISANANTGRDDVASTSVIAGTKNVGIQVALNPQPLPPGFRRSGHGGSQIRSSTRRARPSR